MPEAGLWLTVVTLFGYITRMLAEALQDHVIISYLICRASPD